MLPLPPEFSGKVSNLNFLDTPHLTYYVLLQQPHPPRPHLSSRRHHLGFRPLDAFPLQIRSARQGPSQLSHIRTKDDLG